MQAAILTAALTLVPALAPAEQYAVVGVPATAPRVSFPERRVWAESQAWWRPKGETGVGEHVHCAAAVPIGQTVSGELSLDVRIQLHDQPQGNEVNMLRIMDEAGTLLVKQPLAIRPDEHGHADAWVRGVTIDTTKQRNGRREYRFTANMSTRADGKRQYQSTGWCWYVSNPLGGIPKHARSDRFHVARGWYTGADYANAEFASPFPFAPVKGKWTFNVKLQPGSGGEPVTSHMVTVSPDFHAGSAGRVVKEGSGPYSGAVTVDTTLLSNGVHRLVLLSHQEIDSGRNSGVLVVPFAVRN